MKRNKKLTQKTSYLKYQKDQTKNFIFIVYILKLIKKKMYENLLNIFLYVFFFFPYTKFLIIMNQHQFFGTFIIIVLLVDFIYVQKNYESFHSNIIGNFDSS